MTELNRDGGANGELRLAIDVDEVLADTLGKQLDCQNRRYGARMRPADPDGVELAEIVPSGHRQWVLEMMHEPGFFAAIPPMAKALDAMVRLCRRHRVHVWSELANAIALHKARRRTAN